MSPPGSTASLDDWLEWQMTLAPREIDLGLERVAEVLERLSLPRPPLVLTVAGTNGKGSCVVMLHALLRASGRRVGSYTSPHILRYEERIRIDESPVAADGIVAAFRVVEAARHGVPLTYFEYGTLAAFVVFATAAVDAAVLEVGLGGRLDAVNVLDHDGCIITNISMDHSDWLGDSLERIAREKAGVMRRGRPAVFGAPDVPAAIREQAAARGADLLVAGSEFRWSAAAEGRWDWRGREVRLAGLSPPALGGRHQLDNAAAVLALLEAVGERELLSAAQVGRAFAALELGGRQQRIEAKGRRWLLDGAHNEGGARTLAATLETLSGERRPVIVLGILADKDAAAIVSALAPVAGRFITFTAPSSRARSGEDLRDIVLAVSDVPARALATAAEALDFARDATGDGDLIVVAGSFYTLGPALRYLGYDQR